MVFILQYVKIGISHLRYIVATRLLGINLHVTCSDLTSDQADRQDPWSSCLDK